MLIIIADDFKPVLRTYDATMINPATPVLNVDKIAARGISFMNAHTQMAMCAPSRCSFLTSLRPDTLRIYGLQTNQLNQALARHPSVGPKGVATLPQIFKQNGYLTYGVGKIFHENEFVLMQSPALWTTPVYTWLPNYDRPPTFITPYQGAWIQFPDAPDDAFSDGQAGDFSANLLTTLANQHQPWLLMVGLWKPHLPWRAPAKYLDNTTEFNGAFNGGVTVNLNLQEYLIARGPGCGEVNLYAGAPPILQANTVPQQVLVQANQAYHATASYMDAQVGKILDALDSSPAADTTHIVFLGDHGFHLGDHGGLYCKHTNYEQATRTPLIFAPALAAPESFARGQKAYAPVELLDLIPTVVELVGFKNATGSQVWEGTSLMPMLRDVSGFVKAAAVSQYFRRTGGSVLMGYTARTVRYRLTKWCPWNKPLMRRRADNDTPAMAGAAPSQSCFNENYDYLNDPWEQISLHRALFGLNGYGPQGDGFDAENGVAPWDMGEVAAMRSRAGPKYA
jgi:iduronate 2-sulfatase